MYKIDSKKGSKEVQNDNICYCKAGRAIIIFRTIEKV